MNTIKKALYIGIGVTLLILGFAASVIFMLVGNLELADKILAVSISLAAAVFGWWLLRRGSNSVREALGWLFAHLLP